MSVRLTIDHSDTHGESDRSPWQRRSTLKQILGKIAEGGKECAAGKEVEAEPYLP